MNQDFSVGMQAEARIQKSKQEHAEFNRIAKAGEDLFTANPAAYRRKVWLWLFMGYGFVFGVVGIALFCVVGMLFMYSTGRRVGFGGLYVLLGAAYLFYIGLKSLLTPIRQPGGMNIPREHAPKLWAEVDAISKEIGVTPPQNILLVSAPVAFFSRKARCFGLLREKTHLGLGMPLLYGMSSPQIQGVIAHELGFFSKQHRKFASAINHMMVAAQSTMESESSAFLFREFFKWYYPRFQALTLVGIRNQEYGADQRAQEVVGTELAASIGPRMRSISYWCYFYRDLFVTSELVKFPSEFPNLERLIAQKCKEPLPEWVSTKIAEQILDEKVSYEDDRPPLRDRLVALKKREPSVLELVHWQVPPVSSYFEDSETELGSIVDYLSDYGWHHMRDYMHDLVKYRTEVYDYEVNAVQHGIPPSVKEQLEMIDKKDALHMNIIPDLEALTQKFPDSAEVQMALGRAYMDVNDHRGEALVRSAANRNPVFYDSAFGAIQFYRQRNFLDTEDQALEQAIEAHAVSTLANEWAQKLGPKDEYRAHIMNEQDRDALRAKVLAVKGLAYAFLVECANPGAPPLPLLICTPKALSSTDLVRKRVFEAVGSGFAGMVYVPDVKIDAWNKKLVSVPNSAL